MKRAIKASDNMKKWAVTVSWVETGDIIIEAESAETALEYAQRHINEFKIPEGDYLTDSFEVFDEDPNMVIEVKGE